MKRRWTVGGVECNDYGQMDGRVQRDVEGCDVYGAVSRWPLDAAGRVAGAEERILDTQNMQHACAQFSTHSVPACVVKRGDDFIVSLGDGAGFTTVDAGNLGHNPCGDSADYPGAFRAQDAARWNGKTLRLNPSDGFVPHLFTTGHRNPFRMSVIGGEVFATETGW